MPFINELISKITDTTLQEELTERLDLVAHKIKFMEPMPVCVLDANGFPNVSLSDILIPAGGQFTADPLDAVYVIYFESNKTLADLMRTAPVTLNADWQAVKFNRVCLLADDYQLTDVQDALNLIEDIAEILHPGQFIFGYEGDKWIRFTA
jgi:hypothetical protein